jgi:hypothetical protein
MIIQPCEPGGRGTGEIQSPGAVDELECERLADGMFSRRRRICLGGRWISEEGDEGDNMGGDNRAES